jgi:short-subunit dehydrogenase
MPGAVAYGASKAAVRSYGEGLRGACHRHGIEVSVLCPGFVESRMTARNPFPMPFLMDAGRAARIIVRGLARNRARIAFPWQTYLVIRLLQLLPATLSDRLLRRAPSK